MPQINGWVQHWRIKQQNASGPHRHLQTAWFRLFSKHSARLPALLTFQEHCRAQHRLLMAVTCSLLTAVGFDPLAAEISIPTVEVVLALVMQLEFNCPISGEIRLLFLFYLFFKQINWAWTQGVQG